jgi:hypothetical protein
MAQQNYWQARNQRETLVQQVEKQAQEQSDKAWEEQVNYFHEVIPTMIPDFNEDVAMQIRDFAEGEGIPGELLDTIADPVIVKFVDDYRRLKESVSKGQAKRKVTTVKKAPIKKVRTRNQKQIDEAESLRQRALSGDASQEEQMAFLRGMANRSLNNI